MDVPDSLLAPCFIPQKASDNYSRLCHLITLLCGDLFRDILSRYIKPIYLRSQLDNNKQKLVNIFNTQQQNLIYPATGNTSLTTKDFDITIIYILLRNICNIPPHKSGWGNPPAKGDNSIAAGIEKIRLTRNLIIAHSTNGMIEDPVFEKHWNDLRVVVIQIETQLTGSELYKRGVDFLHSCNLSSVGTEADHNEEKSKQDGVDTIYDKRSARFAEFFDEIAEGVPVEKIARLKDFIQNSCKAEDITSLKQAVSARDCLRYLRDAKLFTSSDVIFVQYLFKRINCNELFVECYKYAEKQDALCFYEKPPAIGYQNVLFHVKGNLSDYSLERIAEIRETLAVLLNCTSKEILIGGACPSNSFLLVLSIKETYSCKLLALEQCDKDKLTKLNIDYIIVDLIVISLEPSKEFGWNIYFDPKHFNREDKNMSFQEEKSTVSPSQHITTVFKEAEGLSGVHIHVDCQSTIKNGDTVHLKGILHFHHTVQYLKWQKYHNGKFMDINIHNSRYKGSTNALQNPELVINDVDTEDAVKYRTEVQTTESKEYSNEEYVKISPCKEKPEIEIFSDEQNNRYYIGEDIKIRGIVKNPSAILCMTWQRGNQTINTALPKYTETINNEDENQLIIRNCSENDTGNYFILATCTKDIEDICSNTIYLDIIRGPPMVSLSQLPEPLIDDCLQIRATIRSFPKYTGVIWMKDQEFINTKSPKYEGSKNDEKYSVLSIKHVNREDEKVYTVEVTNDLGTTKCSSDRLKVIGDFPIVNISKETQSTSYGDTITLNAKITSRPQASSVQWMKDNQYIHADGRKYTIENPNGCSTKLSICCLNFEDSGKYTVFVNNAIGTTKDDIDINIKATNIIFIAGPVVVSPSAKIQFQAVYHQPINSRKGEWFRTKNNLSTKLQFGTPGYSIITSSSQPTIQTIEITSQTENGSAFQLSVENKKSNIINVFVDDSQKFPTENEGNCLRFLALQAESEAAMRKYLDCMPGSFNKKWSDFDNFCNTKKGIVLKFLPRTTPRSSSDLDVTTMYAMFRNTIKISPPKRGWGQIPDANDKGKADDIERIRIYRNKISHENSSDMTTNDFNKSALDLIWAIQRLTDYDGQVIQRICTILNRLFCKGQEFDEKMEELKRFRETAKREDIFRENEDEKSNSTETVTAIDKQAIHLPGRLKRYLGETATIAAFIDPNISTLCKVFWQKKNRGGVFYTIDINDWKYTGSTLTFPTPTLNVNFIRKEDGGIYRIIVDTFNSQIYNTVQMDVIKGECDEDENSTAPATPTASTPRTESATDMIEFHKVHDSNIALLHNGTIARKKNGEDKNGVCFTNRPIRIGERIYIRIAETHPKWSSSMDFGLTNVDPSSISLSPNTEIVRLRDAYREIAFDYLPDFNDVMCFTLNSDSTLSFPINDIKQNTQKLEFVSVEEPVWLTFDLYGKTRAIEISSKRIKREPFNSFFREYV